MKITGKNFSLIFAAGALLASLPAAYAGDDAKPGSRPARMEKRQDRIADALNLTEDQRAKFKAISQQEKSELDALRENASARDDRRAKADEIHQKYKAQRDALLTPEQKAKADKMRDRFEDRRERREKDAAQ